MATATIPDKTQVLVIGGGPSGSTVSTLMSQQGIQVTLLERETFPRFHIGESLIPETYWVLERLKMLDKLKKSHFVRKRKRAVRQRQWPALGTVLLHSAQAGRAIANVASAAQRV